MRIIRNIVLLLTLMSASGSYAQEVIQKVSKTLEKQYPESIHRVVVIGEKASINVSGWNNDFVSVTIKPISRNISKSEAISDLKFVQYSSEIKDDQLIIKNSFEGSYEKISSNLSVEIELKIPTGMPVTINNLYGPVSANNLSNVQLDVSYGRINITDISGYSSVKSRYSNISLIRVLGSISIEAEKSDVLGSDLGAKMKISSKYGIVDLKLTSKNYSTVINGYRTEVKISLENFEDFNYNLFSSNGTISIPHQTKGIKEKFEIKFSEQNKQIDISSSYGDVVISSKKSKYANE